MRKTGTGANQAPREYRELADTLTAFFLRWDVEHTRLMLAAISRYLEMRGPRVHGEDLLLSQHVPIPALVDPPGDGHTDTWVDAMRRFALPTPELAAAGALYADWVRALWLGAVAMSLSAQELMFADYAPLRRLRNTRMPRTTTLAAFQPVLAHELDAFRARGWDDPARFVRQCHAFYCYGVRDADFLPRPL